MRELRETQDLNAADAVNVNGVPGSDVLRPVAQPSLFSVIKPYFSIARLDHWFKNVFMLIGVVLAYFCFPHLLVSTNTVLQIAWAFAATCLIASSNYVLNEILDAPNDLSHPSKRYRPIPSGQVRLAIAYAEWIGLGVAGLCMALALNWPFFYSALFLLVMGVIYNVPPVRSKELPYVDVLSESINNPIRLLLGWFAVTASQFPPVSLLIAYWMIGSFFMASKRFAEYRTIGDPTVAAAYRTSFKHYTQERLLISMFFYAITFALFLGVFIIRYKLELILILPLVAGFVTYYLHIAFKQDSATQNPERLYREKGLMIYLCICLLSFLTMMFIRVPFLYKLFNVPESPVPALWQF